MSTRQDLSTLDHSFLIKEGLISQQELNTVTSHILAQVDASFATEKKNNKKIHQRVCPICDARIGHFGTNFKRHVHVCCPLVYDDLMEKTKGEYYSSKKNMEKAGIFDTEWTPTDTETFKTIVAKIKKIQPSVNRKKSKDRKKKITKKELRRRERLEKKRKKEEEAAQKRAMAVASTNSVKQVLVPASALWYNNLQKYLDQQVGETHAMLSSQPEAGKDLLLHQMDIYPFKNDNMRMILQEAHSRDYGRTCDHLNDIFEHQNAPLLSNDSSLHAQDPSHKKLNLDHWKQWIERLDGEISELHGKIDSISGSGISSEGAEGTPQDSKKRPRPEEGDFITNAQQPSKRPRTIHGRAPVLATL